MSRSASRRRAIRLPAVPAEAVSLRSPAMIVTALVAAACLVVSVSYKIYDPDIWENLVVGKAIWQLHRAPTTQLWSWPTYGAPDVKWTWGASALLWPVWERWGVWGVFAWRWATTLAAFGLLWLAGRRMGARGFAPLVVLVACGLVWRARSQARPETLAAVLLAAQVWILETRRQGGKDHAPWLIPLAWAWANVHNTWFLGLGLTGIYLLHDLMAGWGRGGRPSLPAAGRGASDEAAAAPASGARWRLPWVGLAAVAISFANPYGWRALWQPFDFFLNHRNEPIFTTISEMGPIDWHAQWPGLAIMFAGWPALILVRARSRRWDLVEALVVLLFSGLALKAQRFIGFYALVAAPFFGRHLDEWFGRLSRATNLALLPRAALACLACVAVGLPEATRPGLPIGVDYVWNQYPVAACDFMAAHEVRGRGFNQFGFAGYLLYRFWPDRTRLPFMDIHQSGTRRDRDDYVWAQRNADAWRALDRRHAFDYALIGRTYVAQRPLLDFLDADSTWALVFLDDVMALYVRRKGPLAGVAREHAYRLLPAGAARLDPLGEACASDSALRAQVVVELERVVQGSAFHAEATILLANFALHDGRHGEARRLLERALAVDPYVGGAHKRLAIVALVESRPRDALREVELERRLSGPSAGLDVLAGRAWRALGDAGRARDAFRKALRLDPRDAEARDSLAAIGGG